jgi:hypothetical protein
VLRTLVINRDRQCIAALLDKTHACADRWGQPHAPTVLLKLTLEHVKDERGRRQDLPGWCVANCHKANVEEHHESANRRDYQIYLAGVRAGEQAARL